ncbi:hypothetical protein [Pedobacter miscanthi]|nr:hypothetical protein [Pedobacter miscanthi]
MMKSSYTHFSIKRALTEVPGLVGDNNFTLPSKYYASKTKSYNPQDA